ncbi:hypothetical protein FKM82_006400 [Ascaphus truei]
MCSRVLPLTSVGSRFRGSGGSGKVAAGILRLAPHVIRGLCIAGRWPCCGKMLETRISSVGLEAAKQS